MCLACFGGFALNGTTCLPCVFPCTACVDGNVTKCSACTSGFVYVPSNHSCMDPSGDGFNGVAGILNNCGSAQLTTSSNGSPVVTCTLCLIGYTASASGCLPCIEGCLLCNPGLLSQCAQCLPGYYLNSTYICLPC
jgi:hypothetical protein